MQKPSRKHTDIDYSCDAPFFSILFSQFCPFDIID